LLVGPALLALGACNTTDTTGATPVVAAVSAPAPAVPGALKDDLTLGKEHFRAAHYGLAELHFRRAVEADKDSPEGWLGLAASYDRLKRFDLADRAYAQALKLTGPTAAFLNNRGYSYLLRGDIRRASRDLAEAAALAPDDERIRVNLEALDMRARRRI
jgi:Flp pilus assembly protein TadD